MFFFCSFQISCSFEVRKVRIHDLVLVICFRLKTDKVNRYFIIVGKGLFTTHKHTAIVKLCLHYVRTLYANITMIQVMLDV